MAILNNEMIIKIKCELECHLTFWQAIKLKIAGKKYYKYFLDKMDKLENKINKKIKCQ
jgi:hypothetical protein